MNARSIRSSAATLVVAIVPLIGFAAPAAHADTACGDSCTIGGTVQTPLGAVTVTTTPTNVVTVQLAPTKPGTLVFGVPFAVPPGPPGLPGYTRTTIQTATAGTISVDTYLAPSGPRWFATLPNLAIISIHPPGPCRVETAGDTVVFTPIA